MTTNKSQVAEVQQTINKLIQTATNYDIEALDQIYHDDLHVVMVDINGQVNKADKAAFKDIFGQKRDAGDPPMNTWVEFHSIETNKQSAHAVLSRKNNLSGQNMHLMLSIDLVHEQGRWQVLREVIFLRPDEDDA